MVASGGQVADNGYDSSTGCIDLQGVLPTIFVSSEAYSISGDTVYGLAQDAGGSNYAVAWTVPVPEPASLPLLVIAGAGLLRRRRASTK